MISIFMMFVFGFFLLIATYAFHSGGEYLLLKRMQYERPWMAWIPLANYYALADAATRGLKTVRFYKWEIKAESFRFWIAAAIVANFVPIIGGLAMTAIIIICRYICCSRIFAYCENKSQDKVNGISWVSAVIYTVATIKFYIYGMDKKNQQVTIDV